MADAADDDRRQGGQVPSAPGGHQGPDRRKTIDLVRHERGEPERRKLPHYPDPRTGGEGSPPA